MVGEAYVWYILAISVFLNFASFATIFRKRREISSVRSGVELSREELEQLKTRLTKIKNL